MTTTFEAVSSGRTPSPVEPLPHQLLAVLGQHRMATTGQLHDLLRPGTARQTLSTPLNKLRREGLVDYTVLPQSNRSRAWYLTGEGARLVRDFPALRGRPPYPITSATAASLKTPHTLTVIRTHLAFVTDARRRGDEHGHLDWTPEVSHPLSDGEKIITDALMHYTLIGEEQRTKLRAFVEVDRTTMSSERLASKLIDYARLWSYQPQPAGRSRARQSAVPGAAWLRWYPVFPRVLFVLTGASPYVLSNRIHDLQAMVSQHPLVATLARHVPLGAAVLNDLEIHGPTSDVWVPLTGGEPRPWTEL
ncbi:MULTISPECIES: replication-relaxation family protein [unclassified Streptomyces]|uniref:replication-relaxation family protein n=1 Tax=unclassified Streptomyces TaxID=2593676 RepID=UPI002E806EE9|nr:replication-relaxation family protein [Streptomyces sp. NBC_00589]WTI42378.1 replication-relaxation family protein [Streptomyces sp. NBC_00775]WUB23940.1 replication-relaxation family protein [Streptomyces sp. NBC_00589]